MLSQVEGLVRSYSIIFSQYLEKGYTRKVENLKEDPNIWHLLHFLVIRKDKTTTELRIVFDAAVKTNGICLNDAIHQGPELQRDLSAVLTRFRKCPVALVCDVAEMYLRIGLAPQDRKYHRFLCENMIKQNILMYLNPTV